MVSVREYGGPPEAAVTIDHGWIRNFRERDRRFVRADKLQLDVAHSGQRHNPQYAAASGNDVLVNSTLGLARASIVHSSIHNNPDTTPATAGGYTRSASNRRAPGALRPELSCARQHYGFRDACGLVWLPT
ncbi:hypothetical protein QCM80_18535 [Bradyrhizobium sp. SSUT112]|uniref:hypothetical protein n=1 Tax=Bradyrhizobium sp. SSUT112 TaxID=3040604 RepID=UPI002446E981|nr:hypothetical protein [Bradyrhizobium sp. SSUT112]MDH2352634.1 hypothetical protein [Bradyrhizobium sp. SSUT112]